MAPKNTVYLIRCNQSGLHKIGITGDWARRSRELEVGSKTTSVRVVRVNDGRQLERWLHKRYRAVRLPQTEYFQLNTDQLEHVLGALDKAANDHLQTLARRQHAETQLPARQQAPAQQPPTTAPHREPIVDAYLRVQQSTNDQVRRARAQQQAQQAASYRAQAKPSPRVPDHVIAQSFKAWWLGLAAVFFLIVQSQPGADRLSPSQRLAFAIGSGLGCGVASLPVALFLSAVTTRHKP